jgi:multiple sugar transport system substrate-binding protein
LEELKVPGLRYEVAPLPVADEAQLESAHTFADVKSIAIFATTKHPAEAARFVAYLTSPEADRLLIEETAQLPYRQAVNSDPRFAGALRRWPTLISYASQVERSRDLDLHVDIVEIFDILSGVYEAAAIYSRSTPERAVEDAIDRITRVIHAP